MGAYTTRLPAALSLVPWVYFLWSGYDLCCGRGELPPNRGQVQLYVVAPAIGVAIGAILLVLAPRIPGRLRWLFFAAQLAALMPLVGAWTGGI
jgi:hypothetical protein